MNMMHEQYPLVFDKIQCIYTPVCKAASNSLIRYFSNITLDEKVTPHIKRRERLQLHKGGSLFAADQREDSKPEDRYLSYFMSTNEYKNYCKVAFVRNPWSRTVAAFRELLRRSPFGEQKLDEQFGLSYQEIYDLMQGYISFENFINFIINIEADQLKGRTDPCGKAPVVNPHWRQQVDTLHIKNRFPSIEYDFIGKIENMNEDFNYMQKQLGLKKTELCKEHVTKKYDYRLYYRDSETIDLVGEHYKEDIEQFGYTYE